MPKLMEWKKLFPGGSEMMAHAPTTSFRPATAVPPSVETLEFCFVPCRISPNAPALLELSDDRSKYGARGKSC